MVSSSLLQSLFVGVVVFDDVVVVANMLFLTMFLLLTTFSLLTFLFQPSSAHGITYPAWSLGDNTTRLPQSDTQSSGHNIGLDREE